MLDLALSGGDKPVSLREIASRQEISTDYLEQLLRRLRKANLVRSVRGPRGGFVLARPPAEITAWEIVAALEHEVAPVYCVNGEVGKKTKRKQCPRASGCATHLLWAGLARQLRSFLAAKTLEDLARDATTICNTARSGRPLMFHI